jgi:hypothetical protein
MKVLGEELVQLSCSHQRNTNTCLPASITCLSREVSVKQGVVFEHQSLGFLSSKEVGDVLSESTRGVFLYRCSETLEIDSKCIGVTVFGAFGCLQLTTGATE